MLHCTLTRHETATNYVAGLARADGEAAAHAFDQMSGLTGALRAPYRPRRAWLGRTAQEIIEYKHAAAEGIFRRLGVTFAVYSDNERSLERLIPFDIIPRVLDEAEWDRLARGLEQRVRALNAFLRDAYNEREIV